MKTLHVLMLSLGIAALGLAAPAPVSATVVLDQKFDTTDDPQHDSGIGAAFLTMAQTFAVGVTGTLAAVEIHVEKLTATTADLMVDIRALVTGGSPDPLAANALGSVTVSNGDIPLHPTVGPSPYLPVMIDLSPANIAVTAGQTLAFVLSTTAGEVFALQTDYTNAYAAGARWVQNGDGSPFATAAVDVSFATYVDTAAVPEPAALGLFLAGLAGLGWARRRRQAARA